MPEHQIWDGKLLCQLAGLADGAVVLFIRVELLSLAVETEGLVEKPGAALHIGKTEFLKRLVPCAGEFLSIFQHCSEAELARALVEWMSKKVTG